MSSSSKELALMASMGMLAQSMGAKPFEPPYISTNGAAERRMLGPQTQADHDSLAKAEAKRERKAAIRRKLSTTA